MASPNGRSSLKRNKVSVLRADRSILSFTTPGITHGPPARLTVMLGWKRRGLAVWLAYIIMLAFTVPWHEPWNDEAQAWLLSRDLSLPQLLLHGLRYESHPPLSSLILCVPTPLPLGYFIFCRIPPPIAPAIISILLRLP